MSDNPLDEPVPHEEDAEGTNLESPWEAEARELFGPPEERAEKNRHYINSLVDRFSEPVIRGLLTALSHLDRPLCAHHLSELDLVGLPLEEIIRPFEIFGLQFRITSLDNDVYTVEISIGYDTVGDGGRFLIERDGDRFVIKESMEQWIS